MFFCLNPILFHLSRLLVEGSFRDYSTLEEVLAVVPPEGKMEQLHWRYEQFDQPFF